MDFVAGACKRFLIFDAERLCCEANRVNKSTYEYPSPPGALNTVQQTLAIAYHIFSRKGNGEKVVCQTVFF